MTTALQLGDLGFDSTPAGLPPEEKHAYRVGFDRAALKYLKDTGGVAVRGWLGTDHHVLKAELAARGRQYRIDRHESAHRSGMAALNRYRKLAGRPPLTAPRARRRTRRLECPSCGHKMAEVAA